jgi:hypothetical protein
VPFVRVSRDKRGYETIYLVHTSQRRGRPAATRVLYVFRTPPGLKAGRDPFDPELRRTLESQNPGVEFDWDRLSNIPVPPPDVEHWRERRRAEKAAKQARKAEELEESAESAESAEPEVETGPEEPAPQFAGQTEPPAGEDEVEARGQIATAPGIPQPASGGPAAPDGAGPGRSGKRRRRRRGGRRPGGGGGAQPAAAAPPAAEIPPGITDPGDGGEDVA